MKNYAWHHSIPDIRRRSSHESDAVIPLIVCIIHTKSKDLIKLLEQNGWVLRNVKGSHHVYSHPVMPGHISVPHPKKDFGAGLIAKLLKQAGLK